HSCGATIAASGEDLSSAATMPVPRSLPRRSQPLRLLAELLESPLDPFGVLTADAAVLVKVFSQRLLQPLALRGIFRITVRSSDRHIPCPRSAHLPQIVSHRYGLVNPRWHRGRVCDLVDTSEIQRDGHRTPAVERAVVFSALREGQHKAVSACWQFQF